MELVVDLSTASVVLRQRDEAKRFSVVALPNQPGDDAGNGALGALAAALSLHDVGTVDPGGDVFVAADVVRRMAADAATEEGQLLDSEWEADFASMLEVAAANGWIAEDGSIRAHVVWRD
jgi:hypothetical protein